MGSIPTFGIMSIYHNTYKDDIAISKILKKNSSKEPHTVVYHGGPWHGKREPYDPKKCDMRVMEPMSNLYYSTPNDTMMTNEKMDFISNVHLLRIYIRIETQNLAICGTIDSAGVPGPKTRISGLPPTTS